MSAVEEVLKSLGLVPKDPVQWDPQDVRAKPLLNQVVRNQLPNLTSIQRTRLLDRVGPHVASSLRDRLKGASQSKLVDIARDLSTNEKFKTQLNAYKSALETSMGVPLSAIDQGAIQADDQPSGGATKLRTRFLLPGVDTLRESPLQSLQDIVNADMFDYRTPNESLGTANALYLDNLRNDQLRFYDCSIPRRPEHLEQLVAGYTTIPQFDPSVTETEDAIHDALKNSIIENGLMRIPPISLSLKDTTDKVDPFGLPRKNSFMIPVSDLTPGFRTVMQGCYPGYLDAMGFRPDYDPLRDPDQPSRLLPAVPAQSAADQIMQYNRDGSDYLWSTGYYPSIPRGEGAGLRGSQWLDA